MAIKKHIPNSITILNLLTGSVGVYYAFQANYQIAFFAVLLAAFFDFLDGMAARLLKAYSPMGKELDSLADMISFGLLPGAIAFTLLSQTDAHEWLKFVGFLIPAFSALRLAKFNIDDSQSSSFIGLATPANTIFWVGIAYTFSERLIEFPWLIVLLIVIFSSLLVSKLPMFALKVSSLKWSDNKMQYIFLVGCIAFIIFFGWAAFAPIIAWYIFASAVIYPFLKK